MKRAKTAQGEFDFTATTPAMAASDLSPGAAEIVAGPLALREWLVGWLETLPASLTRRGVLLLPSEALAHQLRRHVVVTAGQPGLLLGVAMQRPSLFAADLLTRAGRPRAPGHEPVRWLLLRDLFERRALAERLRYFKAAELSTGRGYVDAFARAIADLEAAGLTPADLRRAVATEEEGDPLDSDRLLDVATVWEATVEGGDGTRLTSTGLVAAASRVLKDRPLLAESTGPVAALLLGRPTTVLLEFLATIPEARVAVLDARPHRPDIEHWRERLGEVRAFGSREDGSSGTEEDALARLRSRLFAATETAIEPDAGRKTPKKKKVAKREKATESSPPGSAKLAMMASVVDEVDSAASWVIEEIADGTSLDSIAIIVPDIDTYAPLIIDRLQRIEAPAGGRGVAVAIPKGLRASRSPAGLRLAALLRAVESYLEAEATLRLLPWLRSADEREGKDGGGGGEEGNEGEEAPHPLTPSRAAELIYGAGIVGGREARGDEWSRHLGMRAEALTRALDELRPGPDEPEKRRVMRDRRRSEADIAHIERLRPAIAALESLTARVRSLAPLAEIWNEVAAFARDWLKLPPMPPNLPAILAKQLTPLLDHPAASSLGGVPAVQFLAERLDTLRFPVGATGAPAVCVTSASDAAGLVFSSVRVLGLAEGVVPRAPHDDPIVPDDLRQKIEKRLDRDGVARRLIVRVEDQVLEDLKDFDRVVCGTTSHLFLTAPRQWLDRSEREMSGVLLEVALALHPDGKVPTLAEFKTRLFDEGPGASDGTAATVGAAAAVLPPAALGLIRRGAHSTGAGDAVTVPGDWMGAPGSAVDLERLIGLVSEQADEDRLGTPDGLLGGALPEVMIPGLTRSRPISASGLKSLLGCPYQFFQQRILHRGEPPRRPSLDTIDPRNFGELMHEIAEIFFRQHGAKFCRQEDDFAAWALRMRRIVEREFAGFVDHYPLRGDSATERERERLLAQAEQLVRQEWALGPREYGGAELNFGDPEPVALEVDGGTLYIEGAIDRVDLRTSVELDLRDLKTGRARDLSERPMEIDIDLQLGVYTLALDTTDLFPGARVVGAAYVYPSTVRDPERRFEAEQLATLRGKTGEWIAIARAILAAGAFVRTPNVSDCRFCPFKAHCGERAQGRSWEKLKSAVPLPLSGFMLLKRPNGPDGPEGRGR
jgi:RecB family exonuclease